MTIRWPLGGPQPAGMALVAAVVGALSSFDGTRTRPATWALLALICLIAGLSDALTGLAAGVVGACLFVLAHVVSSTGGGPQAPITALVAVTFVVAGGLIGFLARSRRAHLKQALGVPQPTGVLPQDEGLAYLDAEWERAETYRRPLSLVALRLDVLCPDQDPRAPRIRRACRRALLTALPGVAVPFDATSHVMAIVAPEHDPNAAQALAGALSAAVAQAFYTDPASQVRHEVGPLVAVATGVASRSLEVRDAADLVTRAQASLARTALPESIAR